MNKLTMQRLRIYKGICTCICFIFFAILPCRSWGQLSPVEGASLHYRIIGFSFPAQPGAAKYVIEIAKGKFTQNQDFTKHISQAVTTDKNRIAIEVPSFGSDYTWRVINKNGSAAKPALHHFSTGILSFNNTNIIRLTPASNSGIYPEGYILVDRCNVIYDTKGAPVWYLPENDTLNLGNDLKISPSGSLTFLTEENGYEIDYNGRITWKPNHNEDSTQSKITCHHELNKLSNGHYMAFIAPLQDRSVTHSKEDNRIKFFPGVGNSTLAEFDKNGNILWSWKSSKYLRQSDLQLLDKLFPKVQTDLHENAFFFDERNNVIYIGMAGISRIIKIQYPSGKVLNEYGVRLKASELPDPDTSELAFLQQQKLLYNDMFSHQHSLKKSNDGYLYVFNNNLVPELYERTIMHNYPMVVKMKETNGILEKVWQFDTKAIVGNSELLNGGGGNIIVRPDNSIFVSMCGPYADMFITDTAKQVLWSAITEKYQTDNGAWVPWSRYRSSIVSRDQLEEWLWRQK